MGESSLASPNAALHFRSIHELLCKVTPRETVHYQVLAKERLARNGLRRRWPIKWCGGGVVAKERECAALKSGS